MSALNNSLLLGQEGGGGGGYAISRSLRFNSSDSAYLSRTPASAGNRKTWTWAGWVKRSGFAAINSLFECRSGASDNTVFGIQFGEYATSNDYIAIVQYSQYLVKTNAVFRDPSAWFHVVIALDTTQATASNRIKIYINGTSQSFATTNYPSRNADLGINQAAVHTIANSNGVYFSGYLADVHFIDGQALDPTSFGEFDDNGIWQPIEYTGEYGPLVDQSQNWSSYAGGNAKSAENWTHVFDGNGISTPHVVANSGTTTVWTPTTPISFTKLEVYANNDGVANITFNGSISTTGTIPAGGGGGMGWADVTNLFATKILTSIEVPNQYNTDPTRLGRVRVNGKDLVDSSITVPNNSFHLPFSDNSTAAALGTDSSGLNNHWTPVNLSVTNSYPVITQAKIYSVYNGGSRGANYSVQYSDDNANWTTAFTGTMSTSGCGLITGSGTGSGSYGPHRYWRYVVGSTTNSHHPNAARYVLSDGTTDYNIYVHTADNCSDSGTWGGPGTTYSASLPLSTSDSLVDVPTNGSEVDTGLGNQVRGNYCTWNPLDTATTITLSNGNLDAAVASGSNSKNGRSTFFPESGKWYWEMTINTLATGIWIGIATRAVALNSGAALDQTGGYSYGSNGNFYTGSSANSSPDTYTTGDVIGCAWDVDAGTIQFYKNNSSQGTLSSITAGSYAPAFTVTSSTDSISLNFGQRPFAYTAPSGFKALCTANLPAPVVTKPSDVFDVKPYTGNGTTQNITGLGFNPDLVWIKGRSSAQFNVLYDSVRGVNKRLFSNATDAETTATTMTAFNADGFAVSTDGGAYTSTNGNGITFASWNWDAGSSTVTNTQGSITSSVRANPTAGFSVVTWVYNSGSGSIGHGLGVAPQLILQKDRTNGSYNWDVYHVSLGATKRLILNNTNAVETQPAWDNTSPTSTLFYSGSSWYTNGDNMVSYCFAPVAGYSSIGSYVGNGSTDGPFVYTGFRPRFILVKRTDGVIQWTILDTARSPSNVADQRLFPNLSQAETVNGDGNTDLLSNGFKPRNVDSAFNANGGTYIYAAFAESPFQYARAR